MIRKFFSTPKGLLIIILAILAVPSGAAAGVHLTASSMISAVGAAAAIDLLILHRRNGKWTFPDGAVLSGMLIAMILDPQEPWYAAAFASAVAILSKYVFRIRTANVFNPAALGLVAAFYVFDTRQNWWGALPDLPPIALALLFVTGIFITDRVNKMPLVLMFLWTYFLLFAATAFLGNSRLVAEIFRTPDLHAVLFFAFFILTDPPTSPVRYSGQLVCGAVVAVASYAFFELTGIACYLLAGVLVGNAWEALRRAKMYSSRRVLA